MNRLYVRKKFEHHPEIKLKLGVRYEPFKKWSFEVMNAYGWLGFDYMINCFMSGDLLGFTVLRLQDTNPNEWKLISKAVLERDYYTCGYCGVVGGRLEIDHKIPFSKGGSDELSNLITACVHCNRS